MSDAIGPGSLVECIAPQLDVFPGMVCEVTGLTPVPDDPTLQCVICGTRDPGLLLDGHGFPGEAFCMVNFRPAGRRDDSLTRRLLEPLPDAVAAPELAPA